MPKPNLFIAGAPKCGTSSLYYYLKQHPDVYMPKHRKEPHFFTTDFPEIQFNGTLADYLALFADSRGERWVGEATTWYLYSKRAAQEIKQFAPDARIIAMLRTPAEMLYSLHGQWLFSGNEDIADFQAALAAEARRKRGLDLPKYCYFQEGLYYSEVARYSEQIVRYYETFGKACVHVVIFDDFVNNTAQVYRGVLDFLEIDTSFQPDFAVVNRKKRARSVAINHFVRNPPGLVSRLAKSAVPKTLRIKIRELISSLNTAPSKRPPLEMEDKRELQRQFVQEVQALEKVIKRDLSNWIP